MEAVPRFTLRRPAPAAAALTVATLTLVAGCTSFADAPVGAGRSTVATATTGQPTSAAGPLAITDEVDLGRAAADVADARVAADGAGYAVLLQGGSTGTVVLPDGATGVTGIVLADVALVDGEPVAAALTAGVVDRDPAIGVVLPVGSTALPTDLTPRSTAPRGLAVLAAAGTDRLFLLAETPDAVGAQLLAVDPATADVLAATDLDLDLADVTAIELVGLAATRGGGVVAGLGVTTATQDVVARLVELDAELEPVGRPTGPEGRLVGLTGDDGTVGALVADADGNLRLVGPQGGRGIGDLGAGSRVAGVAADSSSAGTTVVTAFLDQPAPTVVVTAPDGGSNLLELCAGEGDALAVAAAGDGAFRVVGTCDGEARLWTLS